MQHAAAASGARRVSQTALSGAGGVTAFTSAPLRPGVAAAKSHVLHPGDVVLALRDDSLDTLLGSCVAIILTDPRRTLAAMCHFVHASATGSAKTAKDCSHAEPALATMFALLRQRGINPQMCQAYVYGGGNMFPGLFDQTHVGSRNVRWALAALAEQGIAVLAKNLCGTTYRRVIWTVGISPPQVSAVEV